MISFYIRRSLRRPVFFLSVIFLFFFFTRFVANDSSNPGTIEVKTVQKPVTVTHTRTAWSRTTRTVYADGASATATPDKKKVADKADGDEDEDEEATRLKRFGDQGSYYDDELDQEVNLIDNPPQDYPEHEWDENGLLRVNSGAPHPIHELIERAERDWEAKVAKASKTLEEAVKEYERRYHRRPPLGFDDWWTYVEENNVQLPDEYDQIYKDLEAFWGIDPLELQRIQSAREAHSDSYTLGKDATSPIELVNFTLPANQAVRNELLQGAYQFLDLLKDVQDFIPPFRAVFSPHDNPELLLDWQVREEALKAAAAGSFIDLTPPSTQKLHGWLSACPPLSPAWINPIQWDVSKLPSDGPYTFKADMIQRPKSFIHNHRAAMSPCHHPALFLQHGQFLAHNAGPILPSPHPLIPSFSYGPTTLHSDIITASPINWVSDLSKAENPTWEERGDERLFWRGRNTGMYHQRGGKWTRAQRIRLVEWANDISGGENVTILNPLETPDDVSGSSGNLLKRKKRGRKGRRKPVGLPKVVKKGRVMGALLDIAFAGGPVGCDQEICEELEGMFEWRKPTGRALSPNLQQRRSIGAKGESSYKYVLDVDGNGWSSRFKRLMTSHALIFKATVYPEWFTDRISPWVHYVPVQIDHSDLLDALVFFRGDSVFGSSSNPNDAGNEALAKKIASAGREWSLKYWRREDLTAYMFRLFLEYARVMNPKRLDMYYEHY